jgi:hypothetical protein
VKCHPGFKNKYGMFEKLTGTAVNLATFGTSEIFAMLFDKWIPSVLNDDLKCINPECKGEPGSPGCTFLRDGHNIE